MLGSEAPLCHKASTATLLTTAGREASPPGKLHACQGDAPYEKHVFIFLSSGNGFKAQVQGGTCCIPLSYSPGLLSF